MELGHKSRCYLFFVMSTKFVLNVIGICLVTYIFLLLLLITVICFQYYNKPYNIVGIPLHCGPSCALLINNENSMSYIFDI